MTKYIFKFEEGDASMRDELGGKGAGLAEMTNIGLPVPAGFTITTQACRDYLAGTLDEAAFAPFGQVIAHGDTKSSVIVGSDRIMMNADLRIVDDKQFPFALHYFTGSKEHNIAMRVRAQEHGLKLNEYELAGPERRMACRDEADIFEALELAYIAPELHGRGGQQVEVRYMPHDDRQIDVYLNGAHLCTAFPQGQLSAEQVEANRAAGRAEAKRLGAARRKASARARTVLAPLTGEQPVAEESQVLPARKARSIGPSDAALRAKARSDLLGLHPTRAIPPKPES